MSGAYDVPASGPVMAGALQLVAPPDVGGGLTVIIGCEHEAQRVYTVPMGIQASGVLLVGRQVTLMGWAWVEATGTARAQINLYDGLSNNANLIAPVTLAAGESTRDYLGGQGIRCRVGLFAQVVAGSVQGAVWARLAEDEAGR